VSILRSIAADRVEPRRDENWSVDSEEEIEESSEILPEIGGVIGVVRSAISRLMAMSRRCLCRWSIVS